jgi:hypothetical protein
MATETTVNNAIEKDSERRKAMNAKAKHDAWERKHKLIPFHTKDGKTCFYCASKEKGESRLAEYERRQKQYIGI